jgi:hypothetical protein
METKGLLHKFWVHPFPPGRMIPIYRGRGRLIDNAVHIGCLSTVLRSIFDYSAVSL